MQNIVNQFVPMTLEEFKEISIGETFIVECDEGFVEVKASSAPFYNSGVITPEWEIASSNHVYTIEDVYKAVPLFKNGIMIKARKCLWCDYKFKDISGIDDFGEYCTCPKCGQIFNV